MDKRLLGAVIANSILNEGKIADAASSAAKYTKEKTASAAKYINKKAPAITRETGKAASWIGGKVREVGDVIKNDAEKIASIKPRILPGKLAKYGGKEVAKTINTVAKKGLTAASVATKGIGTVVRTTGDVTEKAGTGLKGIGEKWQNRRDGAVRKQKADAEAAVRAEKAEELRKKSEQRANEDDERRRKHEQEIADVAANRVKEKTKNGDYDPYLGHQYRKYYKPN